MKKLILKMMVVCVFGYPMTLLADQYKNMYFTGKDTVLTKHERDAIKAVERLKSGASQSIKPMVSPDGTVQFIYGAQKISVVCAVLQVCDIALQPGEKLNGPPHVGDPRWVISSTISGRGPSEIQHIIVKPVDIGLQTSLILSTDRRTYHITLRSHKTKFMPRVSFIYMDDVTTKWSHLEHQQQQRIENNTIPTTREYLGNLDFDYKVSGRAKWKPIRVYNDGVKTIIQMPSTMNQSEAPTLLVIRGKNDTVMVNYRIQGERYIVDSVFDKAIMVAGVGKNQDKIKISRSN